MLGYGLRWNRGIWLNLWPNFHGEDDGTPLETWLGLTSTVLQGLRCCCAAGLVGNLGNWMELELSLQKGRWRPGWSNCSANAVGLPERIRMKAHERLCASSPECGNLLRLFFSGRFFCELQLQGMMCTCGVFTNSLCECLLIQAVMIGIWRGSRGKDQKPYSWIYIRIISCLLNMYAYMNDVELAYLSIEFHCLIELPCHLVSIESLSFEMHRIISNLLLHQDPWFSLPSICHFRSCNQINQICDLYYAYVSYVYTQIYIYIYIVYVCHRSSKWDIRCCLIFPNTKACSLHMFPCISVVYSRFSMRNIRTDRANLTPSICKLASKAVFPPSFIQQSHFSKWFLFNNHVLRKLFAVCSHIFSPSDLSNIAQYPSISYMFQLLLWSLSNHRRKITRTSPPTSFPPPSCSAQAALVAGLGRSRATAATRWAHPDAGDGGARSDQELGRFCWRDLPWEMKGKYGEICRKSGNLMDIQIFMAINVIFIGC